MAINTESMSTTGTLGSSQQAQHIIRLLLRSHYLSAEDQLNLALANKHMAGIIDIERTRPNVTDVPFEYDDSLVNQAIKSDREDWLEYLLGVGDFTDKEAEKSINGLLMYRDALDGENDRLHHTIGYAPAAGALLKIRCSKLS